MRFSLIFRMLLAACAILGIALQISQDGWGMLTYYTLLSNLLVAIFLVYLMVIHLKNEATPRGSGLLRIKGAVTMSILITGVIYHFMLAPLVEPAEFWNLRNFLVHYIVPIGFFLDTLLLDLKDRYRWFDPLWWTAAPLLYSVFALLNGLVFKIEVPGSTESPFPYFFVNVTAYGWAAVGQYVLGIFISYVVAGYLLLLLKKFIGSKG